MRRHRGLVRRRPLLGLPFRIPLLGVVLLAVVWGRSLPTVVAIGVGLAQIAVVAVAVIHAEEIAHRVGEPFGTLVLAVAVTVIEVALIVTLMISEGDKSASLARDAVFAAVMIVCNGIVGVALLLGARRTPVVTFSEHGANALLGSVLTLAGLSLVMPTFTESSPGPTFSGAQLAFAGVSSAVVYGIFVFVQTLRHRGMFLAPGSEVRVTDLPHLAAMDRNADADRDAEGAHHETCQHLVAPSLVARFTALAVSLVIVVGLAKTLSKPIEKGINWAGAPPSFVGVVIALMVLMPESVAAFRAAFARGDANESQPRPRVRTSQHRTHHPSNRPCVDLALRTNQSRTWR